MFLEWILFDTLKNRKTRLSYEREREKEGIKLVWNLDIVNCN